ncbi:PD-(D/E)XK nuclease family protein [Methanotrichaceae archaeon M04Ac]|uniref:PD-(D/E)XK nuclease family protein n=1 Tax=Candidatus Methanocrinis alkalitolerans TaxID=3033395 RepID=A0ABT5XHL6_9EURY|nr:PD-(D/E)XK nuclease family protein [Candidatus Methanocrinis alkalitolerans]MCR3883938.1 PD-(D/E)XK nuclease family protein [Methanothrix sp.]MDF0594214.1 PD-(D/E)XK nuclease family protein [Candidatus Methanocrinis alkalitolerans]
MIELMLKILRGPALSGKTERLAAEMEEAHRDGPLSYTFIGPSAGEAAQFAERFARRVAGPAPAGSFVPLSKVADDLHRAAHPDEIRLSRGALNLLAAEALAGLDDEDLGPFGPLRSSPAFSRHVAEAVWDLSMKGKVAMAQALASEEAIALALKVEEMVHRLRPRGSFDISDAFLKFEPESVRGYVKSRYGTRIFVDGLADLTGAEMNFLARLIPLFEEGTMTLDPALWRQEGLEALLALLVAEGVFVTFEECLPENGPLSMGLDAFLRDVPPQRESDLSDLVSVVSYPDPDAETYEICRETKRLIVDEGLGPGEISIVVADPHRRGREILRALERAGVPARLAAGERLIDRRAVQLLLLPFRAAARRDPEAILALLDLGLDGEVETSGPVLAKMASSAGLLLLPPQGDLSALRRGWRERFKIHHAALMDTVRLLSADDRTFDAEVEEVERRANLCMDLLIRSEPLFDRLEEVEAAIIRGGIDGWAEELRRWTDVLDEMLSDLPDLQGERAALRKFLVHLERLVLMMKGLGRTDLTFDRFLTLLWDSISAEAEPSGPTPSGSVEILSPALSRERYRRVKFVAGFSDGLFPTRRANPLYNLRDFSCGGEGWAQNRHLMRDREERVRLRGAFSKSSRSVVSLPEASREGEPLVPSLWLSRIVGTVRGREGVVRAVEPIPKAPPAPLSNTDLAVICAHALAIGGRSIVPEEYHQKIEDLGLSEEGDGFRWRIDDPDLSLALLGRSYSYSRIREFESCPFKFFLKRALEIDEPEAESFDLSPMERGLLRHCVLEALFAGGGTEGRLQIGAEMKGLQEDVMEVVERMAARFLVDEDIRRRGAVRRRIVGEVASEILGYLVFEAEDPVKAAVGARVLTEVPFRLPLGEMREILPLSAEKYADLVLRGRIDRIDLSVPTKKGEVEVVLSDYKSTASTAEWEQLQLYSLALLALGHPGLPASPGSMRALFRIIRKPGISRVLEVLPKEARMVRQRSKPHPTFSDLDRDLLEVLDRIFVERSFRRSADLDGSNNSCFSCAFKDGPCIMAADGRSR